MEDAHDRLRSWWRAVPDEDPRKQQVASELMNRHDVHSLDDIWSRAVPVIIHGDAFPITRT